MLLRDKISNKLLDKIYKNKKEEVDRVLAKAKRLSLVLDS